MQKQPKRPKAPPAPSATWRQGLGLPSPLADQYAEMNNDITLPVLVFGQRQPVRVSAVMRLEYRPRLERRGYRLDKFSVFLGAKRIIGSTSSPLYAGARVLLERGHTPEQLMTITLGGRAYGSFVPAPIGELAKWTIEESDQRGLSRREWRPFSGRVAQDGRSSSTASSTAAKPPAMPPRGHAPSEYGCEATRVSFAQ